jgi:hypothetical protein
MLKQMLVSSLMMLALVPGAGLAQPVISLELGDSRIAGYSGSWNGSIIGNNTDVQINNTPVCRFNMTANYSEALQYFATKDLTGYQSLNLDLYSDNSGAVVRFSLWDTTQGNQFVYKDIALNWSGWQSKSLNLDGSAGGFDYYDQNLGTPRQQALANISLFSIGGPWNATASTFYLDNVQIVAVPEPASLYLLGLGTLALVGIKRSRS